MHPDHAPCLTRMLSILLPFQSLSTTFQTVEPNASTTFGSVCQVYRQNTQVSWRLCFPLFKELRMLGAKPRNNLERNSSSSDGIFLLHNSRTIMFGQWNYGRSMELFIDWRIADTLSIPTR